MISKNIHLKKQVKVLKSLAHPNRLAILEILRRGERRVGNIEAHLGLGQPYCSQQLALLRKAGLVQGRQEGHNVFYHVSDARIFDVMDIIKEIVEE